MDMITQSQPEEAQERIQWMFSAAFLILLVPMFLLAAWLFVTGR
jgi:hypothetical protein